MRRHSLPWPIAPTYSYYLAGTTAGSKVYGAICCKISRMLDLLPCVKAAVMSRRLNADPYQILLFFKAEARDSFFCHSSGRKTRTVVSGSLRPYEI